MSTFIQATLPTTRLKTLSKKFHASSRPVTSLGILVLLSGTQVGRFTSTTPDTMIEIGSLSGSKTGIPASPEEVRKSEEFMPIYLFERTDFPRRYGSPFIGKGALKGPGGIGDSLVEKNVTD